MSTNVRKTPLNSKPETKYQHYTKSLRLPILIEGMQKGLTFKQVAAKCGVTQKTIERDFKNWKDNGGFDQWLLTEFLRLHNQELKKPEGSQAYKVTADLLKKRLKEQSEVTVESGNNFVVRILDNSKQQEQEQELES